MFDNMSRIKLHRRIHLGKKKGANMWGLNNYGNAIIRGVVMISFAMQSRIRRLDLLA